MLLFPDIKPSRAISPSDALVFLLSKPSTKKKNRIGHRWTSTALEKSVISKNWGENSDSDPKNTKLANVKIWIFVKFLEVNGLRIAETEKIEMTSNA